MGILELGIKIDRFPLMCIRFTDMGTSESAVGRLRGELERQERSYAWLSRGSGVPYKRLLSELKYQTRPLSLETAISAGRALGVTLPDLVAPRAFADSEAVA